MIEEIVLNYLNEVLDVQAYMQEPAQTNPPRQSFVVIQKTGSGIDNKIKRATFAIQSYGDTILEACELNEAVKEAMDNIITLSYISRCKLQTDYEYTKITTKYPRYQAVYEITYY